MKDIITSKSSDYNFKIFFLFLLVTLANYYIYVGFAIKPYMIFLILFLIIQIGSIRFQRLHLFEVALLFFYIMYSYSGAFALYPESSLRIICGITLYIFCYFIMKSVIRNTRGLVLERAISDTGIFFNIASLTLYLVGLKNLGFVFEGDRIYSFGVLLDRDYPRLIGLLQDPNFFVFYNTVFYTYYLCNAGTLKNKLGLLLCIIANILSFSRGGLLVMVFILILYIVINNPIKKLKLLAGLAVSLSAALFIAIEFMHFDVFGILQSRVGDLSQDGGSGRLELWSRAWDYFTSHMIFGIGAFNFADYNFFQYRDNLEVHNTFLDILSESGLLGMTCFILFISLVLVQIFKSSIPKNNPYLLLTFLGLILQMAFLSVIINDMFFMFLAILTTYLHNEKNLSNEEKKNRISFSSLTSKKHKVKSYLQYKGSETTHEYSSNNG
ncbi:O-antigen ligase family protein [Neobacillus cucumis]|uniref:O-antigen ligase family protein n=1 Tax=Neobacillus cucumis TaxID=1740721 RepID=UPI00285318DD|nr:O-antigen ligase family protein [Neobacillus cucumis]MDR4949079.1 O-antigen ligase family protein [Neobacillus cucumis]